jgi:hypothetical protein
MEEDNTCVSALDLPVDSPLSSSDEKVSSSTPRERCTVCYQILRKRKAQKEKNKVKGPRSEAQAASIVKARAVRAAKLLEAKKQRLEAMNEDEVVAE